MSDPVAEPRWRRLPEARPLQIIEAAFEIFGEKGVAAARLDDIAKRAGVSKGTIYLYFASKEELFREMVRHLVVENIERAEQEVGSARGSATDALVATIRGVWAFQTSKVFQVLFKFVASEFDQHPDLAEFYGREVVSRALGLVAGIIEQGVRSGEFRAVDPPTAARMLFALTATNALWCARRNVFVQVCDRSDAQVLDEITHFFLDAIAARRPGAGTAPAARAGGSE